MQKNILLIYLQRALALPGFNLPYQYIYFVEILGLSEATALALNGIYSIAIVFLEVPTGVIADKVSRKLSLGLGNIVFGLGILALAWTNSYLTVLLAIIIQALGRSLISGADKSVLYDSLLQMKREKEYKKISTFSYFIMFTFTGLTMVMSGFTVDISPKLPFILSGFTSIISSIFAFLMLEPKIESEKGEVLLEEGYLKHTLKSFKSLISLNARKNGLFTLVIGYTIFVAVLRSVKWFYTPVFDELKLGVTLIGGLSGFFYLIKAVGALVSSRIETKQNYSHILTGTLLWLVGYILMTLMFSPIIAVLVFTILISTDQYTVAHLDDELNKHIQPHYRATVLSTISLLERFAGFVILTMFGWIIQAYSARQSLLFVAVAIAFSLPFFIISRNVSKRI